MRTTLIGSFMTVVVSVMLMVDMPVKANDPQEPVGYKEGQVGRYPGQRPGARTHVAVRRRVDGRLSHAVPEEVQHVKVAPETREKEKSHEEDNGSVRRDDPAAQCRACRLSAAVRQARGGAAPTAPADPGSPLDYAFPGRAAT